MILMKSVDSRDLQLEQSIICGCYYVRQKNNANYLNLISHEKLCYIFKDVTRGFVNLCCCENIVEDCVIVSEKVGHFCIEDNKTHRSAYHSKD